MQLRPVEIEALVEGAREAATAPLDATGRDELATGSQRIVSPTTTPTVALTPVEIDAIVRGHTVGPVEASTGASARSATSTSQRASEGTVESVRLARGSASVPPTATPDGHARGPRRGRETLRADRIRTQPHDGQTAPSSAASAPAAPASTSPASAAPAPVPAPTAPASTAAQPAPSRPARRTLPWRKR